MCKEREEEETVGDGGQSKNLQSTCSGRTDCEKLAFVLCCIVL